MATHSNEAMVSRPESGASAFRESTLHWHALFGGVQIGGAVEFDYNRQLGLRLGWVLGWGTNQDIKIRKVFDVEILAREDCPQSKRITAYMKP